MQFLCNAKARSIELLSVITEQYYCSFREVYCMSIFQSSKCLWYILVRKRNAALHFANFSLAKLDAALDLVGYSNSKGITGEGTP